MDIFEFIKKDNLIKTKILFTWRTHVTKTFDKIKLKSQPNTPETHRLSLSLIKPFLQGHRNYHIYQYSENVLATIKNGIE